MGSVTKVCDDKHKYSYSKAVGMLLTRYLKTSEYSFYLFYAEAKFIFKETQSVIQSFH